MSDPKVQNPSVPTTSTEQTSEGQQEDKERKALQAKAVKAAETHAGKMVRKAISQLKTASEHWLEMGCLAHEYIALTDGMYTVKNAMVKLKKAYDVQTGNADGSSWIADIRRNMQASYICSQLSGDVVKTFASMPLTAQKGFATLAKREELEDGRERYSINPKVGKKGLERLFAVCCGKAKPSKEDGEVIGAPDLKIGTSKAGFVVGKEAYKLCEFALGKISKPVPVSELDESSNVQIVQDDPQDAQNGQTAIVMPDSSETSPAGDTTADDALKPTKTDNPDNDKRFVTVDTGTTPAEIAAQCAKLIAQCADPKEAIYHLALSSEFTVDHWESLSVAWGSQHRISDLAKLGVILQKELKRVQVDRAKLATGEQKKTA